LNAWLFLIECTALFDRTHGSFEDIIRIYSRGSFDGMYGSFDGMYGSFDGMYGSIDGMYGSFDGMYGSFDGMYRPLCQHT